MAGTAKSSYAIIEYRRSSTLAFVFSQGNIVHVIGGRDMVVYYTRKRKLLIQVQEVQVRRFRFIVGQVPSIVIASVLPIMHNSCGSAVSTSLFDSGCTIFKACPILFCVIFLDDDHGSSKVVNSSFEGGQKNSHPGYCIYLPTLVPKFIVRDK